MTEVHLFDIYRSANIGIFLKANDDFSLAPMGLAATKAEKLAQFLKNEVIQVSVASSRLIGPLVALNNKGMVVSRLTDSEEVNRLSDSTGLTVQRLESRFTSVGNLIAANDHGAIVSDVFGEESVKDIERALEVPAKRMRIGTFVQVGAMIAATNSGALIHPTASESEISAIAPILGFDPEPATINGGIPFVSSGFVGNSKAVLVGTETRGSELVILGRAFG